MLNNFGKVYENASLEKYNSYGIKTSCKYLIKVSNSDNLILLLKYLNDNKIPFYVLGRGSNVILPDKPFRGVIISLEDMNNIEINGNIVTSDAGVILGKLVRTCINNNLGNMEYLLTIPGTLGGAIYGNAGIKEHDIFENIKSVWVIRNNKLVKLNKEDIKYSYRYTMFKENKDIIVKAEFLLEPKDKKIMEELVKEQVIKRKNSQPLEYKNAGSVFKNPEGTFAGKLIEELGLKGFSINDAEISTKHANFIINKGNATSKDIKDLIKYIKDKVYDAYNIKLELEQIIIDWD